MTAAMTAMKPMLGAMLCCAIVVAAPGLAAAYTCRVSPAGDSIIVKTGNSGISDVSCTVTCRFATPQGPLAVTCTQTIPAGAPDWYVCVRPTGGKSVGALEGGEEKCGNPSAARQQRGSP
jgi:hypothetical protein